MTPAGMAIPRDRPIAWTPIFRNFRYKTRPNNKHKMAAAMGQFGIRIKFEIG